MEVEEFLFDFGLKGKVKGICFIDLGKVIVSFFFGL